MWFLFHRKEGTKAVADGKSFTETCPTCQRETRFAEVEVSESYGVWFVDVIGDSARAFRCTSCGDTFDLKEPSQEPGKATEPVDGAMKRQQQRDRLEQLAAEQRRRDADAAQQRAKVETKIDDELAELKKRMGC